MTALHEPARAAFQHDLDSVREGQVLQLTPQEFAGPVVIRRRCTIDGQGATSWALRGPVVTIEAEGVTLRNLRLEVTGGQAATPEEAAALWVRIPAGFRLDTVQVRGGIIGLAGEEGGWRYPPAVGLGQLEAGQDYHFKLRLAVPVPCKIVSHIAGLDPSPAELQPGPNEVRLSLEELPNDTLLHGRLELKTAALARAIQIFGHVVVPDRASPSPEVLWQPADWDTLTPGVPVPEATPGATPAEAAPPPPPVPVPPPPPVAAPVASVPAAPLPAAPALPPVAPPPLASTPAAPTSPPVRAPGGMRVNRGGPLLSSLFS